MEKTKEILKFDENPEKSGENPGKSGKIRKPDKIPENKFII